MAKKPTVTTLQSGFNSTEVLNENFENIRDAFDNTLSLDGSTPNALQADLDLNGNNLIGATGLLINGTDYLADVETAKAAALVAQAAAELAENNAETAEVNAEASETAAGLSATAAATSATNAGASETAASASATASATSATNSSTSASQAATSASAAAVSEGNAATSETNAANSATSASGSASTATTQASAASVSATNAATSASNAATSETNAAASQAAAATSETNAAASESTVATSATNAATSEANAATSASTATTQATNAATSASAASTSASNAATSATNAATSEANALSYVADSESARDQSQAARDTANLHKLAAEAAATSATSTAAALTGFDLEAIAASKAVTAVDVFVYDTSKDSDGGAWRKRTQGTSWYNETLNTATRGSRREFPAVAVIVAESNKVTIYDGDDPALPMWMVFNSAAGNVLRGSNSLTSISGKNGLLVIAGTQSASTITTSIVRFCKDEVNSYSTDYWKFNGDISQRNDNVGVIQLSVVGLVNVNVNDVAMTVLPDAPIDAATGLPVPTIAVATAGGVSVIKDDGTVVDLTYTYSTNNSAFDIGIDNTGRISWGSRNISSAGTYLFVEKTIPVADKTTAPDILYTPKNVSGGSLRFNSLSGPYITAKTSKAIGSGGLGLTHLAENPTTPAKGMVAYTTSTYNTGWMNGDIKGAFLSDTDDTDLVGSELVTNGAFDTDTDWTKGTGWTISGGEAVATSVAQNVSIVSTTFTTVVGKQYAASYEITGYTSGSVRAVVRGAKTLLIGSVESAIGVYEDYFVADSTSTTIELQIRDISTSTLTADNVSVRLADADRSVNNNGLIVNGTVTRTPVATGADLVAYSGFSASNYLEQPYNPDLDFGTGDFCVMGWVKTSAAGDYLFQRSATGTSFYLFVDGAGLAEFGTVGGGTNYLKSTTAVNSNAWVFVAAFRSNGVKYISVNGSVENSSAYTGNLTGSADGSLVVGASQAKTSPLAGSLALLRISATAPSAEQIAKIYNDEKVLFQENAQATLYGASDAVTALAHDDATNLLHVGTSAGRSVFQGLRRVSNTTTAVGTAISASGGMVVDE